MNIKKEIANYLKDVIKNNYDIILENINLENPPKRDMGDFAFGCFVLSKDLKKSPIMISEELSKIINKGNNDLIESSNNDGPYLNIKVNKSIYTDMFLNFLEDDKIISDKEKKENSNKTIIVDYIGANVGKPMHIGHICPGSQGQVIINVYKKLGYNVISDSHIGDWGIIFGKLITAYKLYGNEKELEKNAVEHLFQLYVKITKESEENNHLDLEFRKEFKKLSKGDKDSIKLWSRFTKESIIAMQILFDKLNVKAKYNIGESFYEGLGLPKMEDYPDLKYDMKSVVQELIEKNIATKNEDLSVGVIFSDEAKIPSCILQKRDGTHGYLASDLSCIKYRLENWSPEKIIHFVDSRQRLHNIQFTNIASRAGYLKREGKNDTKIEHAFNGNIVLKEGAMSTRKGRIIKLEKLLNEAETRAKDIILEKRQDFDNETLAKISKIVGIGAIKYGYLKKTRESDTIFDWDEFMSFEGNSGPYIQYSYVRARKILIKCNHLIKPLTRDLGFGKFEHPEEIELIKELLKYIDILNETLDGNYPHILAGYSYALAKKFSSFYNNVHIINEEDIEKKKLRILLVSKFCETLKDSFELLGIDMPEEM